MDSKFKTLTVSIILLLNTLSVLAISSNDSLAYELQRKKINSMLDARSQKFGQYSESLEKRTGFFGLKTKKDMQKSINILAEIIGTDNAILKETKVLLDYKTFEQDQTVQASKEIEIKNLAYMKTINKLENENEKLQKSFSELNSDKRFYKLLFFGSTVIFLSMIVFLLRKISTKR